MGDARPNISPNLDGPSLPLSPSLFSPSFHPVLSLLDLTIEEMSIRPLNDHPFRPIELVAHVVEIVYDSKDCATLRSCMLVCHSWYIASRLYIFRRVQIVSGERLEVFNDLLDADPTIGPLVHELTIRPERSVIQVPVAWVANFPTMLVSKLTNLAALQLAQLYELGDFFVNAFFHELAQFQTVTRLTVRDSSLALRMIFALACALPGLRDLRVGNILPMPTDRWLPPPRLFNPSLTSAEVHIGDRFPRGTEETLAWVLSTNSRARLHTLDVLVYLSQARGVMGVLQVVGAQLRHLDLHFGLVFGSPMEYQLIKDGLRLDPCGGLRTLSFHICDPACQAIVSLLGEITSPDIRRIAFHVPSGDDHATLPDCSALDAALNSPNLLCLEDVSFRYEGPLCRQEVLERMREELPFVNMRGLLRVGSA